MQSSSIGNRKRARRRRQCQLKAGGVRFENARHKSVVAEAETCDGTSHPIRIGAGMERPNDVVGNFWADFVLDHDLPSDQRRAPAN
jgi:hypothetical protein